MTPTDYVEISRLPIKRAMLLQSILAEKDITLHLKVPSNVQQVFTPKARVLILKQDLAKLEALLLKETQLRSEFNIAWDNIQQTLKILVPIEFSPYSWQACQFAFDYAAQFGYKITLLHVFTIPQMVINYPDIDLVSHEEDEIAMVTEQRTHIENQLREFTQKVHRAIANRELPQVEFEVVIQEGIINEEIQRWCLEMKPLMIIMGTRGKHDKAFDLTSSITADVIERCLIPVLAIPESSYYSINEIEHIAFVTNFEPNDLNSYDRLLHLNGFQDKRISFIVVLDKKHNFSIEQIKEHFSNFYPDEDVDFFFIQAEDLTNQGDQILPQKDIDLVVFPTHKRNVFLRLFNPSIVHEMVFNSNSLIMGIRDC